MQAVSYTHLFQLAFGPLGNADFGFTSGNRQTLAADIGADGCIGQVSVQFRAEDVYKRQGKGIGGWQSAYQGKDGLGRTVYPS